MKLRFARFEFKKEDFWIGIFWKKNAWCNGESLDIWICLYKLVIFGGCYALEGAAEKKKQRRYVVYYGYVFLGLNSHDSLLYARASTSSHDQTYIHTVHKR